MVHSSIHARTAFLFSSPGVLAWTIAAGGVGTHAHAARARVAFSAPLPSPRAIWLVGTSTESASTGVGTMPESSRRPAAGPTPGSRSAHFVGFPASQNVPEASRAAAGQGAEGSVPLVAQSCWSVFLNMSKTLDWSATSDRHRDMDGWLSLARPSVRPRVARTTQQWATRVLRANAPCSTRSSSSTARPICQFSSVRLSLMRSVNYTTK